MFSDLKIEPNIKLQRSAFISTEVDPVCMFSIGALNTQSREKSVSVQYK